MICINILQAGQAPSYQR